MQTKKRSFKEALFNTFIGFIISLIFTPIVFSICGVKYSGLQMGMVTFLMTIISIARSYIIRRVFNRNDSKASLIDRPHQPKFNIILKKKRDYYGNTEAAIEFAAEQYAFEMKDYLNIINPPK